MYIEPMLAKHKVKNSNEYGSARFSSFKEIKSNFKKEIMKKNNEGKIDELRRYLDDRMNLKEKIGRRFF